MTNTRPALPPELLRASLGQVLFKSARLFNELAIARVQAREPRIRVAHTQLFPHLNLAGVRPTRLAQRLGISKQAVGALLNDLVDFGMVERVVDPTDGRAQLVRLTAGGVEQMRAGLGVLEGLSTELAAELGEPQLDALGNGLRALLDALEAMHAASVPASPPDAG